MYMYSARCRPLRPLPTLTRAAPRIALRFTKLLRRQEMPEVAFVPPDEAARLFGLGKRKVLVQQAEQRQCGSNRSRFPFERVFPGFAQL